MTFQSISLQKQEDSEFLGGREEKEKVFKHQSQEESDSGDVEMKQTNAPWLLFSILMTLS